MDTKLIITIKENEKIYELLSRMLEIKKLENKEVECELNGRILTTENSSNIQEMAVNNSAIIFEELEKDREILLATPTMKKSIESFENRGTDEFDTQEEANLVSQLEEEFDKKTKELGNLDFSKSSNVYNWLNSLVDYVNNINLYIPLDREDYKYASTANYIVKKLEEHGYTTAKNPINNLDDYYRRLISYQLEDLDKYQFFAYDYADELRDKEIITEEEIQNSNNFQKNDQDMNNLPAEENEMLLKLEEEKQIISKKLFIIEQLINGTQSIEKKQADFYTIQESYDSRKRKIKEQIAELEQQQPSLEPTDVLKDYQEASNRLQSIVYRPGRFSTDEEIKAMQCYYSATASTANSNIIKALEVATMLPISSEIKEPLIDAIVKLSARYAVNKTEEEKQEIVQAIERLGLPNTYNNPNPNPKIAELNKEYNQLETEQQKIINSVTPQKEKLIHDLEEIEKQIVTLKNPVKPNSGSQEKDTNPSITDPIEEDFATKLARIAQEGPIMREIDREEWMEAGTAEYFSKLHNNKINEEATKDNNNLNSTDIEPKETSSLVPHPIKAIKQATNKLKEKITTIDFKNKIKKALEWMKTHQLAAITLSALLITTGVVGLNEAYSQDSYTNTINKEVKMAENQHENILANNQEDIEKTDSSIVEENIESTTDSIQSEETDNPTLNAELDEALNNILNGQKVYSSAYDAANDVNSLSTTESHRENSWANATANAFYDSNADVISREEAEEIIANGGEVQARFDNNGTPIGYARVGETTNENTSGIAK